MFSKNHRIHLNSVLGSLGMGGLLLLGACSADFGDLFDPVRVERHEQAGTVSLTVTMVAPWEDLIDDMSPKIGMDYATAKAEVLPTTAIQTRQDLRATGMHLGIGIQKSAAGAGTSSPTAPGAPEKDKILGRDREAKDLPAADTGKERVEKLEADPMLVMKAGTALVQEGALLDKLPKYAALKRGHRVFVVRLQLSVIPYRRNLPYDIFSLISFHTYAKKGEGSDQPLKVLPLLVTDNLEGTLSSRSRDDLRQITFALSAVLPSIAANFSLSDLRELVQSFIGNELNSLLTIGRVTDNTLQVRLGAPRQPTAGYAMVPRTHNITALLLVPDGFKGNNILAVARSEFRDVSEDAVLRPRPIGKEVADVTRGLAHLGPGCFKSAKPCPDFKEPLNKEDRDLIPGLIRSVIFNDLPKFENQLRDNNVNTTFKRDMWTVVADALSRNGYTADRFELPERIAPAPPPDQAPTFIDDGSNMVVRLQGGQGLRQQWISAKLVIKRKGNGGGFDLVSSGIATPGGRNPVFTFPSLHNADVGEVNWSESSMQTKMAPPLPWLDGSENEKKPEYTPLILLKPKAGQPKAAKTGTTVTETTVTKTTTTKK